METQTPTTDGDVTEALNQVDQETPRARRQRQRVDAAVKPDAFESKAALNAALSEELGDQIYSRDAQWMRFAQEGVIVELHLERKRFRLQLTLADLGIVAEDEAEAKKLESILAPGHRYLLPKAITQAADAIDSRARENLKRYGLRTFWGRFVHKKNYLAWKEQNDAIRADYLALVDQIESGYDDLKREALEAYLGLCSQTYDKLALSPSASRIPGFGDKTAWIAAQVDRMRGEIPTMAEIRPSFVYTHEATSLPTMAQVEQDRVDADRIRLSAAEQAMLADLEETAKARVAGGVSQFMVEVRGQVQEALYDVMSQSLRVLRSKDGQGLGRNTSVAIQKLINACEDRVFWSEGNLEDRLRQLQQMLDTPSRKRNYGEVEALLRTVGAEARLQLLALDQEVAGRIGDASDIGIPADVDGLGEVVARAGFLKEEEPDLDDLDAVGEARVGDDDDDAALLADFEVDLDGTAR
jgi:hypothetical protein